MTEPHPQATDADVLRAEGLLFDLAGQLRRAPVHATLRFHLRALQIKRIVTRWSEHPPDEASRRAVIDELLALQREVRALERSSDAIERGTFAIE